MDMVEFVGEPSKNSQMVVLPILNMCMARVFPRELLDKLHIRLEIQEIPKWSKEEPTVEVFEDEGNANVFGVLLLTRLPAKDQDNRTILKDMFSLLSINLIVCRLKMQGTLMMLSGREYYKGTDITDKDVSELPYMKDVLDETEENLDLFMAWMAKNLNEFFV